METFDYVIIGAGSAGSVLANRLSEDPASRVCVLEAGPTDWHPYIHLPAGFIKTFHMKSVNWGCQQEPGPWTGGRSFWRDREGSRDLRAFCTQSTLQIERCDLRQIIQPVTLTL